MKSGTIALYILVGSMFAHLAGFTTGHVDHLYKEQPQVLNDNQVQYLLVLLGNQPPPSGPPPAPPADEYRAHVPINNFIFHSTPLNRVTTHKLQYNVLNNACPHSTPFCPIKCSLEHDEHRHCFRCNCQNGHYGQEDRNIRILDIDEFHGEYHNHRESHQTNVLPDGSHCPEIRHCPRQYGCVVKQRPGRCGYCHCVEHSTAHKHQLEIGPGPGRSYFTFFKRK